MKKSILVLNKHIDSISKRQPHTSFNFWPIYETDNTQEVSQICEEISANGFSYDPHTISHDSFDLRQSRWFTAHQHEVLVLFLGRKTSRNRVALKKMVTEAKIRKIPTLAILLEGVRKEKWIVEMKPEHLVVFSKGDISEAVCDILKSSKSEKGHRMIQDPAYRLKRLELKNIKCFTHLDLSFVDSMGQSWPWMVFVSDARGGKTTIMESIALATMGKRALTKCCAMMPKAESFIRAGYDEGSIRLELYAKDFEEHTLEVSIKRDDDWFDVLSRMEDSDIHENQEDVLPVFGFGAFRQTNRLDPDEVLAKDYLGNPRFNRVANLLKPNTLLLNPDQMLTYLRSRKKQELAKVFGEALSGLTFSGAEYTHYDESLNDFIFRVKAGDRALSQLGASEEVFCSWLANMLFHIIEAEDPTQLKKAGDYLNKPGLLLLDEIDVHKWPEWQEMLAPKLDVLLPNFQIITSSNSVFPFKNISRGLIVMLKEMELGAVRVNKTIELPDGRTMRQRSKDLFDIKN